MGELIRLKLAPRGLVPVRSWRANEIDRLQAIANVAGILARLVSSIEPRSMERDLRVIAHGRHLLTSLALLDLTPGATAGREDAVMRQADSIEDMIRDWQAMLEARPA